MCATEALPSHLLRPFLVWQTGLDVSIMCYWQHYFLPQSHQEPFSISLVAAQSNVHARSLAGHTAAQTPAHACSLAHEWLQPRHTNEGDDA